MGDLFHELLHEYSNTASTPKNRKSYIIRQQKHIQMLIQQPTVLVETAGCLWKKGEEGQEVDLDRLGYELHYVFGKTSCMSPMGDLFHEMLHKHILRCIVYPGLVIKYTVRVREIWCVSPTCDKWAIFFTKRCTNTCRPISYIRVFVKPKEIILPKVYIRVLILQ